jgi:4-hydroxyphenylpyruvate dioxygenase-like putative hemolysin
VHCDPIDFEILQPLEGASIYKEHLERRGEGLHHVAVVAPSEDVNEALNNFKNNGINVIMSGRLGEDIRFYYMDTDPVLKMTAETVSGHAISMKPIYTYP